MTSARNIGRPPMNPVTSKNALESAMFTNRTDYTNVNGLVPATSAIFESNQMLIDLDESGAHNRGLG